MITIAGHGQKPGLRPFTGTRAASEADRPHLAAKSAGLRTDVQRVWGKIGTEHPIKPGQWPPPDFPLSHRPCARRQQSS
ncbi:hypothetical protein DLM_2944 [Aquitalea magnusonii]|uniref:Uncharacterized protein n=1 Tax=Aquitalea magnusonii TaxID=332411 RepID=A0A3G9GGE6_9NEIS|nr:hypothetical protein DLM_2944 [Aquitalea magnusonii]